MSEKLKDPMYTQLMEMTRMEFLECHGMLSEMGVPRRHDGELLSLSQRLKFYTDSKGKM